MRTQDAEEEFATCRVYVHEMCKKRLGFQAYFINNNDNNNVYCFSGVLHEEKQRITIVMHQDRIAVSVLIYAYYTLRAAPLRIGILLFKRSAHY